MAMNKKNELSAPDTNTDVQYLIGEAQRTLQDASSVLDRARIIAERCNFSVDRLILDASYQSSFLTPALQNQGKNESMSTLSGDPNSSNLREGPGHTPTTIAHTSVLSTTGGHSNTDHLIYCTGDSRVDKISEYKRSLKRRARAMMPENRSSERWDQPRIAGSRRRRITREKDLPSAPPEPPMSGYILFVSQMTIKIRHDRPNVHHNQIKIIGEISNIWQKKLSKYERDYYTQFAKEAREEYDAQHMEFRATGAYTVGQFERLHGDGPWIRRNKEHQNALEREISSYDTIKFAPRLPCSKPDWVQKIEEQNARETKRRKLRQENKKKKEAEEIERLRRASLERQKRIQSIMKSVHGTEKNIEKQIQDQVENATKDAP